MWVSTLAWLRTSLTRPLAFRKHRSQLTFMEMRLLPAHRKAFIYPRGASPRKGSSARLHGNLCWGQAQRRYSSRLQSPFTQMITDRPTTALCGGYEGNSAARRTVKGLGNQSHMQPPRASQGLPDPSPRLIPLHQWPQCTGLISNPNGNISLSHTHTHTLRRELNLGGRTVWRCPLTKGRQEILRFRGWSRQSNKNRGCSSLLEPSMCLTLSQVRHLLSNFILVPLPGVHMVLQPHGIPTPSMDHKAHPSQGRQGDS